VSELPLVKFVDNECLHVDAYISIDSDCYIFLVHAYKQWRGLG